jgi:hypothetical protein
MISLLRGPVANPNEAVLLNRRDGIYTMVSRALRDRAR